MTWSASERGWWNASTELQAGLVLGQHPGLRTPETYADHITLAQRLLPIPTGSGGRPFAGQGDSHAPA